MTPRARERAWDLGLLFAAKGLIGAWVLSRGFSHVSDDDYARVVIAELFAHTPKIDPSGTSWLPFPFWLNGTAMLLLGRSLGTAKALALVMGIVAVAPPYLALRKIGVGRGVAVAGVGLAMAAPWSAWLGVSTVPEAFTAGLVAAGALLVLDAEAWIWAAAGLLVAALSRYEAWPACAILAGAALWTARKRGLRGRAILTATLASVGPLAWLAWNAHAHGDALHFFARVAKYRQGLGGVDLSIGAKLAAYPMALVRGWPEIAALAMIGAFSLGDRAMRARWRGPLAVAAAIGAFLVYGDLSDGAPTHHPERALLGVAWILAPFGIDGARALLVRAAWLRPRREAWAVALVASAAVAWVVRIVAAYEAYPGRSEEEQRAAQVARGLELRAKDASALDVTPCAFEHFAVLAAFGAPERATVAPSLREAVTAKCPRVIAR